MDWRESYRDCPDLLRVTSPNAEVIARRRRILGLTVAALAAQQAPPQLPSSNLQYAAFKAQFAPDGVFRARRRRVADLHRHMEERGRRGHAADHRRTAGHLRRGRDAIATRSRRRGSGLSSWRTTACQRRMILNESTWRAGRRSGARARAADRPHRPAGAARRCRSRRRRRAAGHRSAGRTPSGIADGQNLPDKWDGKTGENILWRTPIPGLAHSSPVVWGDRIFVTSAISSKAGRDVQAGALRRRRCVGRHVPAQVHALRDRQAHRQDRVGAHRVRRTAAQQAPHQVHLRERVAGDRRPHRRRLVRLAGRPRLRRERHSRCGRSISARSTWAPTTSRPSSGDRRARRSSGRTWCSCRWTRRPTRSCSRWTSRPARRCGRPIARSCRRGARRR